MLLGSAEDTAGMRVPPEIAEGWVGMEGNIAGICAVDNHSRSPMRLQDDVASHTSMLRLA